MDCSRVKELMSMYIDGELNMEQGAEFEAHMTECPSCREEYEDMVKLVEVLRSMQEEDLPVNFREELHGKLLEAKEDKFTVKKLFYIKNFRIKALATIAAGALVVFALRGIFIGNFIPGKTRDESVEDNYMAETYTAAGAAESAKRALVKEEGQSIITFTDKGEDAVEGSSAGIAGDIDDGKVAWDENAIDDATMSGDEAIMFSAALAPEPKEETDATEAKASRSMMEEPDDKIINGYSLLGGPGRIRVTVAIMYNVMDRGIVRAIAIDNGGIFDTVPADLAKEEEAMGVMRAEGAAGTSQEAGKAGEGEEKPVEEELAEVELEGAGEGDIVEFTIQGSKYRCFLDVLEQNARALDASVYHSSPVIRGDIEARINELSKKVGNINRKIEEIESNRCISESVELEELKSQRENAKEEIRKLIENSDYIADVVINVIK